MSDFVFYPVTGDGQTSATAYTWQSGTINNNTPSDWAAATSFQTLTIGTPPTTGTVPNGATANAGLIAGAIDPAVFALYTPDPAHGDPFIASNVYPVDVLLNSGSIELNNLLLAGFNQYATVLGPGAPAQFPTLDVEGASLTIDGAIVDTGTVTFPPIVVPFFGTISSATASGGGTIDLGQGASVTLAGAVPSDIDVNFQDGSGNTLVVGVSPITNDFAGTITGFVPGDTLVLPNVPLVASGITTTASFDISTGVLELIVNDPTTIDLHIPNFSSVSGPISLIQSGSGIELVTCFVGGTRIATLAGYVPVEQLRVGDVVRTADGGQQAIRWIGHRRVDCREHPRRADVRPVRICAHAFGASLPERDLLLSPQHAIFAEDVLIPAKYLVNGTSVRIVQVDHVEYFHIELSRHDLLIAEGLPTESYLDCGDRLNFENGGPTTRLHADFASLTWESEGCAPLRVAGPEVETVRARLAEQAIRIRPIATQQAA